MSRSAQREVQCSDFKGRWETEEQARSAIDHIRARGGKQKGMPRFVVPCGAHFHISSRDRGPL